MFQIRSFLAAIAIMFGSCYSISAEIGRPSGGLTLEPPNLNDNPMATITVNTTGLSKVELNVYAYKCRVDENGRAVRRSCDRGFMGITNSAFKVLPGYYLISATVNPNTTESTIYSEKPMYIKSGENVNLYLKPIRISPSDRLLSVKFGVDLSNPKELLKLMTWDQAVDLHNANSLFALINLSCTNSKDDQQCGHKEYLPIILKKAVDSMCMGSLENQEAVRLELISQYQSYASLYRGAYELYEAIKMAFNEDRNLKQICQQNTLTDEMIENVKVERRFDGAIHYDNSLTEGPFFKIINSIPTLELVRDPDTQTATWSVSLRPSQVDQNYPLRSRIAPVKIKFASKNGDHVSAYVFSGTYFVNYEFEGNWDNKDKRLTQTQYGLVVE
jgi:hypothetical protein